MNKKNEIERFKTIESNFTAINQSLEKLDDAVDEVKSLLPQIDKFNQYYGSEEWYLHREMRANGDFDELLTTAVLSEDYPYDTIIEIREQAIKMLELATELLK